MRLRALTACLALVAAPALAQDSVEQFYRGKNVTLVIGSGVGGGYDFYGRLVGRYIGKYIPGKPNIVVANMAGAGGNTAVGHVYSVAPKDGTYMVASSSGSLLDALIGDKSIVRHEPLRLQFIGSANSEVSLCILRKDAPAQSFAETLTKEVLIGSSGGTTRDLPTTLIRVLGSKMKLISGYPGTREVMLAMEKGEVHGICGIGYTSTISQRPDWLKPESPMRAILQEAIKGLPELDRMGVPGAMDFAKTDEQKTILEIIYSQLLFTRPFMMAPEVPADRVEAIRKAFMQALADPELIAEGAKMHLVIDAMPGAELERRIRALYATAPETIDNVRRVLSMQAQ
mgnify:CR=1 FL=1